MKIQGLFAASTLLLLLCAPLARADVIVVPNTLATVEDASRSRFQRPGLGVEAIVRVADQLSNCLQISLTTLISGVVWFGALT